MEKDVIVLPEEMIQHIQSFLSGKEAAQTSILSKSWYRAWLTRPNLYFDERDFETYYHSDHFLEFVKKTMQRYQDLNLNSQSFRLLLFTDDDFPFQEFIVKAMNMGVTDLNFESLRNVSFDLLNDEVLGSEKLVRLSLKNCKIDRLVDGKVCCSRLESLSLCSVQLERDMMREIISSCPLIEDLSLCRCTLFFNVVEDGKFQWRYECINLHELHRFHNLKSLKLVDVFIDTLFFRDFSSKFPCLKDLAIHHCRRYNNNETLRISSRSLECISLAQWEQWEVLMAKFDVRSIRKFIFLGSHLPCLSFETASIKWESDISITWRSFLYGRSREKLATWFVRLNEFLANLSQSKICLSLNIEIELQKKLQKRFDYRRATHVLPKPVVENLTMHVSSFLDSSVYSALLAGFFWSCRPKFFTLYWSPVSSIVGELGRENNYYLEILCECERLIQQVSPSCCIPNRGELEDVNVEYFEETFVEWRPLPWKTLLDASACPNNKRKVRFRLKWGTLEPTTF